MAAALLAYPDLAVDKFSGTDPDQDAETFIQLIERKINFALEDAPGDAGKLKLHFQEESALFLFNPRTSRWRTILPTQQLGRMFEQISSLDFQMDETNSDTAWEWNIVLEKMEKKFGTFYTVSNERLIKCGPMIWTVD